MCGDLPYISYRPTMATASPARDQRLDARVTREEKKAIEEAANLLGVERDLLWFARAAGLKELACNLAREQGWTPALSVVSAGAVGAAVPLPL